MYESSQYLVGCIINASLLAGIIAATVTLITSSQKTEYPPHGTRIGNHRDQSAAAIVARSRVAAGWTGDGSADYCTPARRSAPTTEPATAEKVRPSF